MSFNASIHFGACIHRLQNRECCSRKFDRKRHFIHSNYMENCKYIRGKSFFLVQEKLELFFNHASEWPSGPLAVWHLCVCLTRCHNYWDVHSTREDYNSLIVRSRPRCIWFSSMVVTAKSLLVPTLVYIVYMYSFIYQIYYKRVCVVFMTGARTIYGVNIACSLASIIGSAGCTWY